MKGRHCQRVRCSKLMGMYKVGDLIERRVGKRKENAVVESVRESDGQMFIEARIAVIDDGRVLKTRARKTFKLTEKIEPRVNKSRLIKQASEERFTLAPWYIPDKYDAQNEWTDAVELQKALWDYVKSGDRDIRLQHQKDIKAGEWVEAMTLPYEWTTPVQKSNGSSGAITYPAGTVLLGVVWEPWAWEMVKSGEITGFSIGGSAERLDLEMGEETA